jgi:hypothetical protein
LGAAARISRSRDGPASTTKPDCARASSRSLSDAIDCPIFFILNNGQCRQKAAGPLGTYAGVSGLTERSMQAA